MSAFAQPTTATGASVRTGEARDRGRLGAAAAALRRVQGIAMLLLGCALALAHPPPA